MSSKLVQSPAKALGRLLGALPADVEADLIYEYGDRPGLHVWILSDSFRRMDYLQRRELVKPALDGLPDDVRFRIKLLFYLTPEEFKAQYEREPEFLEPHDEETDDGPFRLLRPAQTSAAA
jgi:hypothetical protein